MALTGLDIFKKLPKTNCGDCAVPTCLAFAMKIAAGKAELSACPHISPDVVGELSEASAPPIRLVKIGNGENALEIGEEQVMFRHEKTFFHQPGIAVLITDQMSEGEVGEKIKQFKESNFERVGQILKPDMIAVKETANDRDKYSSLIKKILSEVDCSLVLMGEDAEILKIGLELCGGNKPLIHAADHNNYISFAALAKEFHSPLAVKGRNLEELADLVEKVKGEGVKDIILDPGTRVLKETFKNLIFIRRAALRSKFRPFGFPTITFPGEETDDDMMEAMTAGVYIMKYGGIIVINSLEAWKSLPLFVLRQNIYTDPQRPMQVKEGIYPINNPSDDSPVLLTTNFSLTYFTVSNEAEASQIPSWLMVMDVEGLSVLTAWGAGKFVPEKIAPFVKKSGIAEKVKHNKIVIPGFVAQMLGALEEELPDNKIIVGPREAAEIPTFLKSWESN